MHGLSTPLGVAQGCPEPGTAELDGELPALLALSRCPSSAPHVWLFHSVRVAPAPAGPPAALPLPETNGNVGTASCKAQRFGKAEVNIFRVLRPAWDTRGKQCSWCTCFSQSTPPGVKARTGLYVHAALPASFPQRCWVGLWMGQSWDRARGCLRRSLCMQGIGQRACGVVPGLWLLLLYVPLPCLTCSQPGSAIGCPQLYVSFCLSCIIPSVWSAWNV